jgi:hypothetical protein
MSPLVLSIVRWAARGAALVVAGGFFLLVFGEIATPHSGPPTHLREYAGLALLTFVIMAMLSAWKWELPGASLSLGALAVWTYLVHMQRFGVVAVIAIPGILFIADWALRARHGNRSSALT